jgi:DNA-binding CsgD family transcriptional regulator
MCGTYNKTELVAIVDFMDKCMRIRDSQALIRVFDILNCFTEFDAAIACAIPNNSENVLCRQDITNHSYDQRWVTSYVENHFAKIDPVIAYADGTSSAFRWSDALLNVYGDSVTKDVQGFLSAAQDHGLSNGMCHAQKYAGCRTVISFASAHRNFPTQRNNMFDLLLPHIHEAVNRIWAERKTCDAESALKNSLTQREREIIYWVREGKTSWEIGCILTVSERTVKFHLSNIFAKLGVVNRSQAVARAMSLEFL